MLLIFSATQISLGYFPVLAGAYPGQMKCLDQLPASENI